MTLPPQGSCRPGETPEAGRPGPAPQGDLGNWQDGGQAGKQTDRRPGSPHLENHLDMPLLTQTGGGTQPVLQRPLAPSRPATWHRGRTEASFELPPPPLETTPQPSLWHTPPSAWGGQGPARNLASGRHLSQHPPSQPHVCSQESTTEPPKTLEQNKWTKGRL